jgi:PAS domain S-box-containing protein
VATSSRRTARPPRTRRDGTSASDPDGDAGSTHELLAAAVAEATDLLEADGAMVYLVDPATGRLRFAHDAGVRGRRARDLIRSMELEPGTGMFGRAVAERAVIVTRDYPSDPSFRHATGPDEVVAEIGIRSMVVAPLTAGAEVFGAIGTFSTRPDAFDAAEIALVRSLADHAAAAMANSRLIAELDRSRSELAERAEVERTLREISVRISAASDLSDVLQSAIDEAARLMHADGARIDLVDGRTGLLRGAYSSGTLPPDPSVWPDDPDETLEQGVAGQAVVTGAPRWTGDYIADDSFPHGAGADTYIRNEGIRSVMAVPLIGTLGVFGTLTVFTGVVDAWTATDAALLEAIAAQSAIAITRARLIVELDRSRERLARRAGAEQALREIAARITALRDPAEILQEVVELASRLVGGEGAILDLLDPVTGNLHWGFDDGLSQRFTDDERAKLWISVGIGATGVTVAEDRVVIAGADLAELFPPSPESTEFYERTGFHSMIAAPVTGDHGPLGVIEVYAVRPDAFDESDADLIRALAGQAAIAITNARLIRELEQSREENARRADTERTLREIAARVSAILDPADVLERIVTEAVRLLASDGARIDLWDDELGALRWAYSAGDAMREVPGWGRTGGLRPRQAVAGLAFAEQAAVMTEDFLSDDRFETTPEIEAFVRAAGIRAVIATPLIGEGGPVGVLSVVSRESGAYTQDEVEVLSALAAHASIAMTNARLIDELERSQAALARRAETERSLRDITARIAALHDPDEVLARVVEDARRLLATDGAHLTRMAPSGDFLVPVVVEGETDEDTRGWLMSMEFPLGGGINGLAAEQGIPVWTFDYESDPRIPHEPDDLAVAERLGLRGMAAAPLRAPGGEVIGTLAVSTAEPRTFEADELDLLQGLADQAAIALTNSNLLARVTREEARFRGLVQTTPDVIWRADADGYFTFMAETGVALFGWPIEELIGKHLSFLTDPSSMPNAIDRYLAVGKTPDLVERVPLLLVRSDGSTFTAEVTVTGVFEDDRWVGAQGTVRDVSDRERLEAELRRSEERYRYLVQNAPDIVWSIDAEARLTFLSEATERLTGFRPDELLGKHFGSIIHSSSRDVAEIDWTQALDAPSQELRGRINLQHRDGSAVPAEFIAIASLDEAGRFSGANGSVRDMRERDRLESELRRSEERYRFLVDNSPDIVFAIDPDGRFSFVSESIRRALGRDPADLIGTPYTTLIRYAEGQVRGNLFGQMRIDPDLELVNQMDLIHADGSLVPFEVSAVGVRVDGEFGGIHGSGRDIGERQRLERDLRESEERYRTLASSSPDIVFATDAAGFWTFLSDRADSMLGWDIPQVIGHHFSEAVAPASLDAATATYEAIVADPTVVRQLRVEFLDGQGMPFPLEVSVVGVLGEAGLAAIHGVGRDVSERERLQGELRRSEERYRFLVENSPDVVFSADAEGRFTFLSAAIETMTGVPADELIGNHFSQIVDDASMPVAAERWLALVADPSQEVQAALHLKGRDGGLVSVDVRARGVTADGRFAGMQGATRDVSEQLRLQTELRRQAGELAAGEERAHLARELHDSVTQALFSMTLVTRSVEMLLDRDQAAARVQLGQLRDLQREALAEMRALIFELRPGNLEQDGLVRALKTHSAALQGRLGLPIVVESDLDERLPLAIEEALYRIAQEALHNVVKHAAAKQVRLDVRRKGDRVELAVIDDGKGFDPAAVPDGHLGLAGMRARADRIGARLSCTSRMGRGTTVEVVVPGEAIAEARSAAPPDAPALPLESASIRDR